MPVLPLSEENFDASSNPSRKSTTSAGFENTETGSIPASSDAETKEIDSGRCEMSGISSGRGSRQGAAADSYRNVPQVSTREISMEMFQNEKHREPERVGE